MILLQIGYTTFAVKSDKEAFAVMTALSKSLEVRDNRILGKGLEIVERQPEIKMKSLPDSAKFYREGASPEEEMSMPRALKLLAPGPLALPDR